MISQNRGETLRPFFSYFGSKYRLTRRLYPSPSCDTIIEPFAGSACYATVHNTDRVILNDLDPIIFGVWSFLIKSRPECIRALPLIQPDQKIDDLEICQEAKWFIGFWLNKAATGPRRQLSSWALKYPSQFWGERKREQIAKQVDKIDHWKITNHQYFEIENQEASWFIDPPYQEAGKIYRRSSSGIDYQNLGDWCVERLGQIIVCENEGAQWLPFSGPEEMNNVRAKKTSEVSFVCDGSQARLFGSKV